MVGANSPAQRVFWRGSRGRLFAFPELTPFCGFVIISGGILLISASALSSLLLGGVLPRISPGYEMFADYYRYRRLANLTYLMPGVIATILIPVGILGVRELLARRPGEVTLLKVGVFVALSSAILTLGMTVSEFMPRYSFEPLELTPLQAYQGISVVVWAVGISLIGFATLRVRSLGAYSSLPLLLGLFGIPPERLFVFLDFPLGPLLMTDISLPMSALIEAPRALSGIGWILFGTALLGAKRREYEMQTSESLATVQRLCDEVWRKGDVRRADELLASDFTDCQRGLRGPKAFRNFVSDLRATFPDMELAVLEIYASGETVRVRWQITGTDSGGLLYFPPTGRRATFTGISTYLVRNGKIIEHRGRTDEVELLRQLGLEPSTELRSDAGRRPGGL